MSGITCFGEAIGLVLRENLGNGKGAAKRLLEALPNLQTEIVNKTSASDPAQCLRERLDRFRKVYSKIKARPSSPGMQEEWRQADRKYRQFCALMCPMFIPSRCIAANPLSHCANSHMLASTCEQMLRARACVLHLPSAGA